MLVVNTTAPVNVLTLCIGAPALAIKLASLFNVDVAICAGTISMSISLFPESSVTVTLLDPVLIFLNRNVAPTFES